MWMGLGVGSPLDEAAGVCSEWGNMQGLVSVPWECVLRSGWLREGRTEGGVIPRGASEGQAVPEGRVSGSRVQDEVSGGAGLRSQADGGEVQAEAWSESRLECWGHSQGHLCARVCVKAGGRATALWERGT